MKTKSDIPLKTSLLKTKPEVLFPLLNPEFTNSYIGKRSIFLLKSKLRIWLLIKIPRRFFDKLKKPRLQPPEGFNSLMALKILNNKIYQATTYRNKKIQIDFSFLRTFSPLKSINFENTLFKNLNKQLPKFKQLKHLFLDSYTLEKLISKPSFLSSLKALIQSEPISAKVEQLLLRNLINNTSLQRVSYKAADLPQSFYNDDEESRFKQDWKYDFHHGEADLQLIKVLSVNITLIELEKYSYDPKAELQSSNNRENVITRGLKRNMAIASLMKELLSSEVNPEKWEYFRRETHRVVEEYLEGIEQLKKPKKAALLKALSKGNFSSKEEVISYTKMYNYHQDDPRIYKTYKSYLIKKILLTAFNKIPLAQRNNLTCLREQDKMLVALLEDITKLFFLKKPWVTPIKLYRYLREKKSTLKNSILENIIKLLGQYANDYSNNTPEENLANLKRLQVIINALSDFMAAELYHNQIKTKKGDVNLPKMKKTLSSAVSKIQRLSEEMAKKASEETLITQDLFWRQFSKLSQDLPDNLQTKLQSIAEQLNLTAEFNSTDTVAKNLFYIFYAIRNCKLPKEPLPNTLSCTGQKEVSNLTFYPPKVEKPVEQKKEPPIKESLEEKILPMTSSNIMQKNTFYGAESGVEKNDQKGQTSSLTVTKSTQDSMISQEGLEAESLNFEFEEEYNQENSFF